MEIYVLHRPSTDVVTLDRLENATPEVACMRTCILYMHRIYMWLPLNSCIYTWAGWSPASIIDKEDKQVESSTLTTENPIASVNRSRKRKK